MNNKDDLTASIAKVSAIVGLVVLLISAITNIFNLVQDERGIRILSVVAFILFFSASLWLAFKTSISGRSGWIVLIALYIVTIIFSIWVGTWIAPRSRAALTVDVPRNVMMSLNFEEQPDPSQINLGICNNSATPTEWFSTCQDAPQKLKWVEGGYGGSHGIESQIEVLPDKEQVYTFRLFLDKPMLAQTITAKMYTAEQDTVYLANIAAWTKDGTYWKVSGVNVDHPGWIQVQLDMQQFREADGSLASEHGITELHLDFYIQKADQEVKVSEIRIDNIEFFYPSSKSYTSLVPVSKSILAQSNFDIGHDGWSAVGAGENGITYSATDGNPSGFIMIDDGGGDSYWVAPKEYLGDKSKAYNGVLMFDLKALNYNEGFEFPANTVVLKGEGTTLAFQANYEPANEWTTYAVPLNEHAGWINQDTGQPASKAEIVSVLASLQELLIRGEFMRNQTDIVGLDNVFLMGHQ
jgi:hypothetical protein